MKIVFVSVIITLILSSVESLKQLTDKPETNEGKPSVLRDLITLISKVTKNGRRLNAETYAKAKGLFDKLTKKSPNIVKSLMREGEVADKTVLPEDTAKEMENEMKRTLTDTKSALIHKPYIEKVGKRDFLVMMPDVVDPYVTVIPNAIFYNIEKKCVNWLDDCSLKGIRQRLLHGVKSPYK